MRTFNCICGNTLYIENSFCLACSREVAWCPACEAMAAIEPAPQGLFRCTNPPCHALLMKCHNYAVHNVCNRCLLRGSESRVTEPLCDCCRFNETIPDLSVPGNQVKWYRLEAAKRRLFYDLDLLRLPRGRSEDGFNPPLAFDFKSDERIADLSWRWGDNAEQVYTGHNRGKITINIREADPAEREKFREQFNERQRTLIGHFRHEIGHYYWDVLVQGRREEEFVTTFGDWRTPTYQDAQSQYYQCGPIAGWQSNFVSAYASMHPWEDFAETFGTYLDMISVVDTAGHIGWSPAWPPDDQGFNALAAEYKRVGNGGNRLNRAMGLPDLVPETFTAGVLAKLRWIHELIADAS